MYQQELQIAIKAAKAAGEIISKHYHTNYEIFEKKADHPVTIADHEADAAIKKIIFGCFPDDGWLSEETRDNPDRLQKERVWIVDPLDGTKEFIEKIPEFAVSIGLCVKGGPVVGVIYNPATKIIYTAHKGRGAFKNKEPLQVSTESDLAKSRILSSRSETKRGEWKPYEGQFEIIPSGGMAHKMTVVACGEADGSFSLTPKTEWDFCAGVLLIQEAGGIVSQLDGKPFIFNKQNPRAKGIIYSNSAIFHSIFSLITESTK